jgi:ribosomal protein L29
MKRNDIRALHDKTVAELQKQLGELQQERTKAKQELSVGKLADVRQTGKLADDIARVKAVIAEKEFIQE